MSMYLRLPDGQVTENCSEFLESWDALIKPIEAILSVKVDSFGPGLRWHEGNWMTDLPVETARKIIDLGIRALTAEAKCAAMKKEKEND